MAKKKRRKIVEFRITGTIPGIKKSDLDGDILETNDSDLIAKLLKSDKAEELSRERVS